MKFASEMSGLPSPPAVTYSFTSVELVQKEYPRSLEIQEGLSLVTSIINSIICASISDRVMSVQ